MGAPAVSVGDLIVMAGADDGRPVRRKGNVPSAATSVTSDTLYPHARRGPGVTIRSNFLAGARPEYISDTTPASMALRGLMEDLVREGSLLHHGKTLSQARGVFYRCPARPRLPAGK